MVGLLNVTTVSPLGSFWAAMAPFLAEAWLTAWMISTGVRLTKSAGILAPRTRISRLILWGMVFVGWVGWFGWVGWAATIAHDWPWVAPWLGPWLGPTAARTASVTTFCRWVTVITSGPSTGWLFCCRVVNRVWTCFARPRAMPCYSVGTKATKPSRRPLQDSIAGRGSALGASVGLGRCRAGR